MSALTTARNTREALGNVHDLPVSASVVCYQGGLAVLNGGYAEPGTTATGLIAAGRFEETVSNASGADGAASVAVKEGDFWFANSASTDLITQAEVGADCYIVDDQTVAKTNGTSTRSRAGKIVQVDATLGVLVRLGIGK
jgi:hypothetical protein